MSLKRLVGLCGISFISAACSNEKWIPVRDEAYRIVKASHVRSSLWTDAQAVRLGSVPAVFCDPGLQTYYLDLNSTKVGRCEEMEGIFATPARNPDSLKTALVITDEGHSKGLTCGPEGGVNGVPVEEFSLYVVDLPRRSVLFRENFISPCRASDSRFHAQSIATMMDLMGVQIVEKYRCDLCKEAARLTRSHDKR